MFEEYGEGHGVSRLGCCVMSTGRGWCWFLYAVVGRGGYKDTRFYMLDTTPRNSEGQNNAGIVTVYHCH